MNSSKVVSRKILLIENKSFWDYEFDSLKLISRKIHNSVEITGILSHAFFGKNFVKSSFFYNS